jgi:dTDP-D-glucose 4,6-dehydratase
MSPEEASKSSSDELSRTSLTKKSINSLVLICAGNNYGSMA